jgi:hypothetical protein
LDRPRKRWLSHLQSVGGVPEVQFFGNGNEADVRK